MSCILKVFIPLTRLLRLGINSGIKSPLSEGRPMSVASRNDFLSDLFFFVIIVRLLDEGGQKTTKLCIK